MKLKLKFVALACLCQLFYVSCNKEGLHVTSSSSKTEERVEDNIKLNKLGFLEFKNQKAFEGAILLVSQMTEEELTSWEDNYDFISARKFYQQALSEEEAYTRSLEKNIEESNNHVKQQQFFKSTFVKANRDKMYFDEEGFLVMNSYRFDIISLINQDGLVKIGNNIFQYTHDYLKVLENANIAKVPLLKQSIVSSKNDGIFVNKVKYKTIGAGNRVSDAKISATAFNNMCEGTVSAGIGYKIKGYLTLATVQDPIYEYYECECEDVMGHQQCQECSMIVGYARYNYFNAEARNYRKNIFGSYVDDKVRDGIYPVVTLSGSYKQDGVLKNIYFQGRTDSFGRFLHTIYSKYDDTHSVDINNVNINFKWQAQCSIIR